jgi:hypothetical protein
MLKSRKVKCSATLLTLKFILLSPFQQLGEAHYFSTLICGIRICLASGCFQTVPQCSFELRRAYVHVARAFGWWLRRFWDPSNPATDPLSTAPYCKKATSSVPQAQRGDIGASAINTQELASTTVFYMKFKSSSVARNHQRWVFLHHDKPSDGILLRSSLQTVFASKSCYSLSSISSKRCSMQCHCEPTGHCRVRNR